MHAADPVRDKLRFLDSIQASPAGNGGGAVLELLAAARPALRVRGGVVEPPVPGHWDEIAILQQPLLARACAAVARLDAPSELYQSVGSAFLVEDDLVMTTRHAVETFAVGVGMKNLEFRPGRSASVDFGDGAVSRVTAIEMIHPVLDVALLRIEPAQGRQPLQLSAAEPSNLVGRAVVLVGHPQADARYDADLQRRLIGEEPGTKRVLPGLVQPPRFFPMLGRSSLVLVHDAVPLGGLMGAPVIELATGLVVGVQFASRDLEGNYAVPASEVARDPKIARRLPFLEAPQPLDLLWDDEWRLADEADSPEKPEYTLLSSNRGAVTPPALLEAVQREVRERFRGSGEFRSFLEQHGHADVVQAVPERAGVKELVRALNRRGAVNERLLHALVPSLATSVDAGPGNMDEMVLSLPLDAAPLLQDMASESAAPAPALPVGQQPFTWSIESLRDGLCAARSVGMLRLPDGAGASGWLLTADLLVAPAHALQPARAAEAVVEFQADESHLPRECVAVAAIAWIDSELDLALLRLALRLEDRAPLRLRLDTPLLGTPLAMLHHPLLGPQHASLGGTLLAHDGREVRYRLDTSPGSTGAPVFDPQWRVVATHLARLAQDTDAGGPARRGAATSALLTRLRQDPGGRPLWGEVAQVQPGLRRVDPALRGRLEEMRPGETLPVVVRLLDADASLGPVPGFDAHSTAFGVVTGVGTRDGILALLQHAQVECVEASRAAAVPECAISVPHVRASHVHAAPHGELGERALVAVVDSGVDVLHEAFRDAAGRSRIVAYWDQHDPRVRAGGAKGAVGRDAAAEALIDQLQVPYGAVYFAADIDAFIAGAALPASFPATAAAMHGTIVSSIAAGRACGDAAEGFAGGVAPAAALAVVRYDLQDASIGYANGHLDALAFIDRLAAHLQLPVVVNISNGMNAGAHDGTSPLERACDRFTDNGARPGRVIVKSAGNERQQGRHAAVAVDQSRVKVLRWRSQQRLNAVAQNRDERVELWFEPGYQYRFSLRSPQGHFAPDVDPAHPRLEEYLPNGNLVHMELNSYANDNADGSLVIELRRGHAASIESGEWALKITGLAVSAPLQKIHAWVEWLPDRELFFQDYVDDQVTVTIPGTAGHVISVGAAAVSPVLEAYDRSSWGPTRKGRETPDLVAPGVGLYAAGASRGALRSTQAQTGTSLAAPHVTGAIALALSACLKSGRPPHTSMRVRSALRNTVRHRTAWSPETGWGELDAQALYQDLLH